MLPFARYPSLRSYLRFVRDVVFQQSVNGVSEGAPSRITLVMGNPSADLDSFISAVTLSYFYNHAAHTRDTIFIPLLNMPKTPSTDLWRLRPEFGVALRLATAKAKEQPSDSQAREQEKELLNQVLTVKDLLDWDDTRPELKDVFRPDLAESTSSKQQIILVDHNAPSVTVPKVPSSAILAGLEIVGCIDHHMEENVVPQEADPRIVTTGIGSCTTLVVNHLRKSRIWPGVLDDEQTTAIRELARLALAPILVDTHNLKASGEKCSDLDRGTTGALEVEISSSTMFGVKSNWNRDNFYDPIIGAKLTALDLLNAQEMFERDYKSWIEGSIEIGISSLVRPIPWLVDHVGGADKLAAEIRTFANRMQDEQTADGVVFDVFVLLTPGADRGKEVLLVTFSEKAAKSIEVFEQKSESLGLQTWDNERSDEVSSSLKDEFGEGYKIWWMTQREKTRKQGAPLVREAVAAIQK
ncbi:uncharacterized protein HMPREF1541_10350 [Cyphellophora europaea CBS 101466]|uniref:DHHA2 domain-containing protein n=1 Tax=Cyphellophora europaea (strain CBS 101466) TaxID=1220924 RepID=W2S7R9_CYPE1|nr:uncharacterized protein HMPREF1541_10350 [Cyphellophora europaea CBS 101466]ETN44680.1 hypothetical protein HMPREF1541_10350 [Cyphellophora europaea CBS 101466]